MKWVDGRQGTGYKVWKFFSFGEHSKFGADCVVIKYPEGTYIPTHKDKAPEGSTSYRLNIILKAPEEGGKFFGKTIFSLGSRVHLFKPSESEHSVSKILKGSRLVFSVGLRF